MAFVPYGDRVSESTQTTGTGTYVLLGARTGYQSFADGIGVGNECYYCCTDDIDWEVGYGKLISATTLERTHVLHSSNADAAVDWKVGTKVIFNPPTEQGLPIVDLQGVMTAKGNIVPDADSTRDLGTSTAAWAHAYVDNLHGEAALLSGNLDVGGNATVAGNLTVTGSVITDDVDASYPAGAVLYADGDGDIAADASNLFWDATNKRLGIGLGTGLPEAAAHLVSSTYGPKLILDDPVVTNKVPIEFRANNVVKWELCQRPSSQDHDLVLYRKGSGTYYEVMRWCSLTGNIGIGYGMPETSLNVKGVLRVGLSTGDTWLDIDSNHVEFNRVGGAGYIDQTGIGGSISFRTSNTSARDTTAATIASDGTTQFFHNVSLSNYKTLSVGVGSTAVTITDEVSAWPVTAGICSTIGGGTYPFDVWGNLLITPRATAYHVLIGNNSGAWVTFRNNGDVLFGTSTAPTANSGKVLVLGDNANDPTLGADTAGLYAKDVSGTVELFAVNEAGHTKQLTETYTSGGVAYADSNGDLTVDASNLFWDSVNKRLGISVTPTEQFEVGNSGRAFFGDGGGGSRKGLLIDGVNTGYAKVQVWDYGAAAAMPLALQNSGGNVGIGYTDPETKLNVSGTVRIGKSTDSYWSDFTSNAVEFNNAGGTSYIDQAGVGGGLAIRVSNAASLDTTALSIASGGETTLYGLTIDSAGDGITCNEDISIFGTSDEIQLFARGYYDSATSTGQSSPVFVLQAGAATPYDIFHVENDGKTRIGYSTATAGTALLAINGPVGIGIENPSAKLQVYNGEVWWGSSTITGLLGYSAGNGSVVLGARTAHGVEIRTNNAMRIFVTSGGYTGFGYLDPETELNMSGTFQIGKSADTYYTSMDNNHVVFHNAGAASFIDQAGVGGSLSLRVSNASSLDTTAMTIDSAGNVEFNNGLGVGAASSGTPGRIDFIGGSYIDSSQIIGAGQNDLVIYAKDYMRIYTGYGGISFNRTISTSGSLHIGDNLGGDTNRIYFRTGSSASYFYSSGSGGDVSYFGEWAANFRFMDTSVTPNVAVFSITGGNRSVRVGNDSEAYWTDISNNTVEFNNAGGTSYIDQAGVGGSITFRTSDSSSLDTQNVSIDSSGTLNIETPVDGDVGLKISNPIDGYNSAHAIECWALTHRVFHIQTYATSAGAYWCAVYVNNRLYLGASYLERDLFRCLYSDLSLTVDSGKSINLNSDTLIGTTTKPTANSGKVLVLGDNAADPTLGADTAGLYAKDVSGTVELFACDEAGNVTQLSPHDPETGEWVFFSHNTKTGITKRVNMEKLVALVEELTGQTLMEVIE